MFRVLLKNSFALLFAIIATVVMFLIADPILDVKKYDVIVDTGIETTAEVVEVNPSTITVMNVTYYSLKFVFEDEFGIKHTGDTTYAFTYEDLLKLELNNSILIKYDPETLESVEAEFNSKDNPSIKVSIVALVVVGIVGLILWIVAIRIILKAFIKQSVLRNGQETTAEVIKIGSNVRVNGKPLYFIEYRWRDNLGNSHNTQTGADYTEEIAKELASRGNIIIKVKGKHSAIVVDKEVEYSSRSNPKTYIEEQSYKDILLNRTPIRETKKCNYCGQVIEDNANFCPNCGAEMNEEENN